MIIHPPSVHIVVVDGDASTGQILEKVNKMAEEGWVLFQNTKAGTHTLLWFSKAGPHVGPSEVKGVT